VVVVVVHIELRSNHLRRWLRMHHVGGFVVVVDLRALIGEGVQRA